MKLEKIECPVYDEECPYFKSGYCTCENPLDCAEYCDALDGSDYDFMEMGYDPYLGGYSYDC